MNLFLTQKNLTPRTVRNTFQHFEDFRNLEHQLQIDSLINFFVKRFSRTSELAKDKKRTKAVFLIVNSLNRNFFHCETVQYKRSLLNGHYNF